jgi:hypothetical protein
LNELFVDYRDPVFGVIVAVLTVFIISFLTYSFGLFKEKKARREYRKLLKRFEIGTLKEDDYVHLYSTYNLPFDSIVLLASTFLHKGNFTKAISVYLALLEVVNDSVKKEELLELLGHAYFKGGFLQRSKEWYDNKETSAIDLTEEQFFELLGFLDFELKSQELENGMIIYFLKDLQDGNLGNIEQDIFYCAYDRESKYGIYEQQQNKENWLEVKDSIINRLEVYLYDYFERDKLYE